jgi:hypothetical protein
VKRSRERDQAVERLLQQSLKKPRNGSVTEFCLDAETVAAWVDGGLSGTSLEMAQSHVADCTRCQALVGTAARLDSLAPLSQPERASRRWLAWAVPLTAAAAGLALWVAVPRDRLERAERASDTSETMQVQRNADVTKANEPSQLDDRSQTPPNAKRTDSRPRTTVSSETAKDAAKTDGSSSNQAAAQPESRREGVSRFEGDSLEKQSPPSSAAAPSASGVPAATDAAAPTPALAESVRLGRLAGQVQTVNAEIVSPDPSVRWRIAGSVVQRSTNGGARWDAVPTGVATPLTSGAAPSPSVCWLVGRAGVVLLSTDALNWRRVAFPEVTDLSAIQATDARTASVSTADGRTFSTTDGGATWVRRPAQDF